MYKIVLQLQHIRRLCLLAGLVMVVGSCSTLSQYTPEKLRNNISYEMVGISLAAPGFTFDTDMSGDELVPGKIRIQARSLVRAALAGDLNSVMRPLNLQASMRVINHNPVAVRVHAISTEVWLDNRLLTTLSNDRERDIPEDSNDVYAFNFVVPEQMRVSRVLLADNLRLQGEAEISIVVKGVSSFRSSVPFSREQELPFEKIRRGLRNNGVELDQ